MSAGQKPPLRMTRRRILGGMLGVAGAPAVVSGVPTAHAQAPAAPGRLADITSWGYQLQQASLEKLAATPYDLLVVDSTKNGDHETPLSIAEVNQLKRRPRGKPRTVLAYVSIGEAEDYRFYWQEDWLEVATPDEPPAKAGKSAKSAKTATPKAPAKKGKVPEVSAKPEKPDRWVSATAPPWLGDENETWGGNFEVKYWDPAWQKLMFGEPGAYLERVIAQGFDGLYLDRVDAYYNHVDEHPTAATDMADFVIRLAGAARVLKPDCIIVPQNAEELLLNPAYLDVIDGIAKEDLLYGSPTEGEPNTEAQVANSVIWLAAAKEKERAVMVVEYLTRADLREYARGTIRQLGFVPYFAPRSLDAIWLPETPAEVKAALAAAARLPATTKKTGQSQTPAAASNPVPPKRRRR